MTRARRHCHRSEPPRSDGHRSSAPEVMGRGRLAEQKREESKENDGGL